MCSIPYTHDRVQACSATYSLYSGLLAHVATSLSLFLTSLPSLPNHCICSLAVIGLSLPNTATPRGMQLAVTLQLNETVKEESGLTQGYAQEEKCKWLNTAQQRAHR